MKLRIKGNSIRLRLTKSEVNQLVETGKVIDRCTLLTSALIYQISIAEIEEINADLIDNTIEVFVPKTKVLNWNENEVVSIEHKLRNGLNVLIEKDFKCLIERPNEDNNDMYENPLS